MDQKDKLSPTNIVDEPIEELSIQVPDDELVKRLVKTLQTNIDHWEQKPWLLTKTDKENIDFLMGDQLDDRYLMPHNVRYVDNRLHASVRAILAYATGQLAKPEVLPSKTDDKYKRIARGTQEFLYQHALDHDVNTDMRMALKNLITRKRGCLKLRFAEDYGPFGDVCTENLDPADVVIGRFSVFSKEPDLVYVKQKCSVEELLDKFPDKQDQIFQAYGYKRGTFSQMSRQVTYWECWFTYFDDEGEKEGLCWFLPNSDFILDKMPNPNWIREGDIKNQKIINLTPKPIKPFVWLNYLNSGRSFIDETCLLDQAIPMQKVLNRRGKQIVENADYAVPRLLVDKSIMDQTDADKFVNKNPKTIGMVNTSGRDNQNIAEAVFMIPGQQLPSFVFQDKIDARNEIDTMMGTPVQFRGDQSQQKSPTLGQDLLVKNQAAALQDDLVGVVNSGYRDYYTKLLQMCVVYLDDDYWVMTKGADGEYARVILHDNNIDTNVRITVQVDSTLPLDKQSQRATAIQLAQIPGRIDNLSLYEMLGLPEPDKLAERVARSTVDPLGYMSSVEQQMFNAEAEEDISLIIAGKTPAERDDYSEKYLNYWNLFLTLNRYLKLPSNIQANLQNFLHQIADKAATTEALKDSMLNPAGITESPINPPMPKVDVRLLGQLGPQDSQVKAGLPPTAQNVNAQQGISGGSPPRVQNPGQFGP